MPAEDLHRFLYVSSAVPQMAAGELEALLARARARNHADGITGLLLYCDGNVMQLLEGPAVKVRATFSRIEADPRHRGLIVLVNAAAGERLFGAWSMAYSRATWDQLQDVQAACRRSGDSAAAVLQGFFGDQTRLPGA